MTLATAHHSIIMASRMGFCGGVKHALDIFKQTRLAYPDERIYILHELVHNNVVTDDMRQQNAHFITAPGELPPGSIALIGAHGVTVEIEKQLCERARCLVDATCPMVKALQRLAERLTREDDMVIYGSMQHPETSGVVSRSHAGSITAVATPDDVARLPYLAHPILFCQTTLSCKTADEIHAALLRRFPACRRASHCCSASQERQAAIEAILPAIDALLVVGSSNSSNANRLCDIGRRNGKPAWLVESPEDLPAELDTYGVIGISAGASTPQKQIDTIISAIGG